MGTARKGYDHQIFKPPCDSQPKTLNLSILHTESWKPQNPMVQQQRNNENKKKKNFLPANRGMPPRQAPQPAKGAPD